MNARMPPMGRGVLAVGLGAAALYLLGLALPSPPLRLATKAVILLYWLGQAGIAASALPDPNAAGPDVSSESPEAD